MHSLRLRPLPWRLAICRLPPGSPVPDWATCSPFLSITRTPAELSIVCDSATVPPGIISDGPWIAVQIEGPLALTLIGVLPSLLNPLAAASISVFVMSTFDTDYNLARESDLEKALTALRTAGHAMLS